MLTSKNRWNILNIYDKQKANFPPKKHRKHINQFKKREREVDNPMGKKGQKIRTGQQEIRLSNMLKGDLDGNYNYTLQRQQREK